MNLYRIIAILRYNIINTDIFFMKAAILLITLFISINPLSKEEDKAMILFKTLDSTIEEAKNAQNGIDRQRKYSLDQLVKAIKTQRKEKGIAKVNYICTHNSRRSQMAQLLSLAIAYKLGVEGYEAYSGGTEVTAFNHRAVAALERAGFQLKSNNAAENPEYVAHFGENIPTTRCFSKVYEDAFNPQKDFIAAMVCSSADESCPIVFGADARISIPYLDPKESDGTDKEEQIYDERLRLIAAEMYYVMSRLD